MLFIPFISYEGKKNTFSLPRRRYLLHPFLSLVPYGRCLPRCDGTGKWYYYFILSVVQCQTGAEEEMVIELSPG